MDALSRTNAKRVTVHGGLDLDGLEGIRDRIDGDESVSFLYSGDMSLLLQIELAGICFGISAFMKKGSIGTGLGIAAIMYFLNLITNITKTAEFLNNLTLRSRRKNQSNTLFYISIQTIQIC